MQNQIYLLYYSFEVRPKGLLPAVESGFKGRGMWLLESAEIEFLLGIHIPDFKHISDPRTPYINILKQVEIYFYG